MSKMDDYIAAGTGYDANGIPASSIQFIFGEAPFMLSETANVDEVVKIHTVYQSDAVAEIKFVDDIATISFDFAKEPEILEKLSQILPAYIKDRQAPQEYVQELAFRYDMAIENEDHEEIEELKLKMQTLNIPFLSPKLFPTAFNGSVEISFEDDPKFILYTSDQLNQLPTKITMVYDANDVYCQDTSAVYHLDDDDEFDDDYDDEFDE